MLLKDSSLVKKITANTKRFRSQMTAAGFDISGDDHPISPVMLGDAKLAADFADDMLGKLKPFQMTQNFPSQFQVSMGLTDVNFTFLFLYRPRHLCDWI